MPSLIRDSGRRGLGALGWAMAAANAVLLVRAAGTFVYQPFRVDEFNYAHMSWMTWRLGLGAFPDETWSTWVPRALWAPVAGLAGPNPANIIALRWAMLAVFVVTIGSAAYIGWRRAAGRRGRLAAAMAGPLFLLTATLLVQRMGQIRPDGVAFAFVCLSLALLHVPADRRRTMRATAAAIAAGLCLGLAVLSTQKAAVYGSVFAIAFVADLTLHRRATGGRPILVRPICFAAGFWVPIVATVAVAAWLGVLDRFWYWLYTRPVEQQQWVVELPFAQFSGRYLWEYPELWATALAGALIAGGSAIRSLRRGRGIGGGVGLDVLTALLAVASWAGVLTQRGAYDYSYIPAFGFCGLTATIAARWAIRIGGAGLGRAMRPTAKLTQAATALLAFVVVIWASRIVWRAWMGGSSMVLGAAIAAAAVAIWPTRRGGVMRSDDRRAAVGLAALLALTTLLAWRSLSVEPTNARQIELLAAINRLTGPDDVAWDATGTYVFRPRAHRFVFITQDVADQYDGRLKAEVERAIVERQAVLWIADRHVHQFDPQLGLRDWLFEHYVQADGDLFVWGRTWRGGGEPWDDKFTAIRDDEYFIWPPHVAEGGRLLIDGEPVTQPIFRLKRGEHAVRWIGGGGEGEAGDGGDVSIVWLPADGRPFEPGPGSPLAEQLGWH